MVALSKKPRLLFFATPFNSFSFHSPTTTKTRNTATLPIEYYPKCPNSAAKVPDWMNNFHRVVGGQDAPSPIPWQVHLHLDRFGKLNF